MKYRITNKNEFNDLSKHIKENKSYNVTIQEAKVRETGFTDRQLEQLAALLVPIHKRLDKIEADIAEIKSLPTIAKELKDRK